MNGTDDSIKVPGRLKALGFPAILALGFALSRTTPVTKPFVRPNCETCGGTGVIPKQVWDEAKGKFKWVNEKCPMCKGTGIDPFFK